MTPANLVVRVETVGDDDPELVNELASDLYETLQESPADRIRRQRGESEAGSKGAALDWAALVVTFSGQLPQIVALIRGWTHRRPDAKVRIELDGDVFEVDNASPELQAQLAGAFLARHPDAAPQ